MSPVGGRRQPERTCIGCRGKAPKAELVRVVRGPGGRVEVDPTGQSPGRGAYVHPVPECVQRAARTGRLPRALRAPLGEPEAARLVQGLMQLAGDDR